MPLRRLALLGSALLVSGQVAGRAVRDAFFLSNFDPSVLPYAMIGASLFSIAAVMLLSRSLVRSAPARVAPIAFCINAALFLVEAALIDRLPALVAALLYLQVSAAMPVLGSAFWSVINECFDPFVAKQIVPRMAGVGALAGVAGGIAAERIGATLELAWALPLLAVLSASCAATLARLGQSDAKEPKRLEQRESVSIIEEIRRRPLLREMALLVALGAVAENLVEYVLMTEASRAIPDEAELVRFFSAFYVGCGLMAFALQGTVSRVILRHGGLAGSIVALPGSVAATGAIFLGFPGLWSAVLVRATETIVWSSTFQAGFELLFTPIPPEIKRRLKSWIDVSVRAFGGITGAAIVLGCVAGWPDASTRIAMTLAVAACAYSLLGVFRIHRAYVSELGGSLRTGVLALREEDVLDATTARTLVNARDAVDRMSLLDQIEVTRKRMGLDESATLPSADETEETPPPGRASANEEGEADPTSAPGPSARDEPIKPVHTKTFAARLELLLSGRPDQVRRALHARRARTSEATASQVAVENRLLAAHAIPLLVRPDLANDARDFLRRMAPRSVGLLVDGVLDRAEEPSVRIALAQLLAAVDDRRALDGLWRGSEDPSPPVRAACLDGAVRIIGRTGQSIPREAIHARIRREVDAGDESWSPDDPQIEFVCQLLALRHGRKTMQSTLEGLRSNHSALRGTAYEFFESVLPPTISDALLRRLGVTRKSKD